MGTKWSDLDAGFRVGIVSVVAVESVLKVVALADLARRPRDEVHGPKAAWAAAILLVNALGAAPLSYLACHGKVSCPGCRGDEDCRCRRVGRTLCPAVKD